MKRIKIAIITIIIILLYTIPTYAFSQMAPLKINWILTCIIAFIIIAMGILNLILTKKKKLRKNIIIILLLLFIMNIILNIVMPVISYNIEKKEWEKASASWQKEIEETVNSLIKSKENKGENNNAEEQ